MFLPPGGATAAGRRTVMNGQIGRWHFLPGLIQQVQKKNLSF